MLVKTTLELEAHQWHENGDHPLDRVGETDRDPISGEPYTILEGRVVRFFNHPRKDPDHSHSCGRPWREHGWIDDKAPTHSPNGITVCPSDWIINRASEPEFGFWRWPDSTFAITYAERRTPEEIAVAFHEAYSRLAVGHGFDLDYATWADMPPEGKELAVAVITDLCDRGVI